MSDFIYATTDDLNTYEGIAISSDQQAERLIRKASRIIHAELKTARYDVDADGMPTDVQVKAKLAEATAAQVKWFQDTGDTTGVTAQATGGSIGSVSLPSMKTNGSMKAKRDSRVSPEMVEILRSADCIDWTIHY